MKKIFCFFYLFLAFLYSSNAQSFNESEQILQELNGEQLKIIGTATTNLAEAQMMEAEADNMFQDVDKLRISARLEGKLSKSKALYRKASKLEHKAIKQLFKSAEKYNEANTVFVQVYNTKLGQVRSEGFQERLRLARLFEIRANVLLEEAFKEEDHVSRNKNVIERTRKQLREIHNLEAYAINCQLKALGLYYDWYSDREMKNMSDTMNILETVQDSIVIYPDINPDALNAAIVYKIQILASSQPANQQSIMEIYNGNFSIEENFDAVEQMYKYTIGHFLTYKEAVAYKEALSLDGAFILALKNGLRINIQQAIEITE